MVQQLQADSARAGDKRRPWLLYALATLALLLLLPGLWVGPALDDWLQAYDTNAERPLNPGVFSRYQFVRASEVALGRHEGFFPWWSHDQLAIGFFRPLSSWLVSQNHSVLDGGGVISHLHSALWFVLSLLAAHHLLKLLFSRSIARLAWLLYALNGLHALPLAFTAALHTHVTTTFALVSWIFLVRALRAEPHVARRLQPLSLLFLAIAFAAGEGAISVLPLAVAYAISEQGWARAVRWVGPHLAATALFAVGYAKLGYGAHHSQQYLAPGSFEHLQQLPARVLALTSGLYGSFPPDLWLVGAAKLLVVLGGLSLLLAALVVWRSWKRRADADARLVVALNAGALLALLPLSAGIPGGRLLAIPALSSAALFALAGVECARALRAGERWRAVLLGAWVTLFGVGLGPLLRLQLPQEIARIGREFPKVARHIGQTCQDRVTLGVGMPDNNVSYLPVLFLNSAQKPRAFHVLSMAPGAHSLSALKNGEFELAVEGDFFELPWSRIYRDTPLRVGQSLSLKGLELRVLSASSDQTRLALRPTEANLCWLTLREGEIVPLPLDSGSVRWTPSGRAP